MFLLWQRSGYGNLPTERAMWIVQQNGQTSFVQWPWSAEHGSEKWKGPTPDGAVAIAHTHPSNRSPRPSGGDRGDHQTSNKIDRPVYVVTRFAIWKAVPGLKNPVQVARSGWWEPFVKEKKK